MAKASKRKSKRAQPSVNVAALLELDYSEAEIAARRDAGLKRLLNTPPKPHTEMTGKKKHQRSSSRAACHKG